MRFSALISGRSLHSWFVWLASPSLSGSVLLLQPIDHLYWQSHSFVSKEVWSHLSGLSTAILRQVEVKVFERVTYEECAREESERVYQGWQRAAERKLAREDLKRRQWCVGSLLMHCEGPWEWAICCPKYAVAGARWVRSRAPALMADRRRKRQEGQERSRLQPRRLAKTMMDQKKGDEGG